MNRNRLFSLISFLAAGVFILSACAPTPGTAAPDPTTPVDPTQATVCPSCPSAGVTLSEQDAGKTIYVRQGETLFVTLDGNITTGFTWEQASTENALVTLTGEPEYKAESNLPGSPGKITLPFKAVNTGQQAFKLVYHQPFDKTAPPEKTFEVTLVITTENGALPLAPETTPQPSLAAKTLSEEDAGSIVRLQKDGTLVVTLTGNPSTGYTWEVTPVDPAVVSLVGEPEYKADSEMLGSAGKISLTFKAVAAGQQALTMAYRRPFEKDIPPQKTIQFTVVVEDQKVTPAPTRQASPTTVAHPANDWKGWQVYTNTSYGFTFQYPPDWTLAETRNTAKSPNTLNGHAVWLTPSSDSNVLL